MNVLLIAANIVSIGALVGGAYLPRHRRADLAVAYVGLNIGVMAVAATLVSSTVTAGLGLGLFGVLSIIRLRSQEIGQREIAYYFSALALGMLGGIGTDPWWLAAALMAAIVVTMFVIDHPSWSARRRHRLLVLERAYDDEAELTCHLASRLGARIDRIQVQRVSHVDDTTVVEVDYTLHRAPAPLDVRPEELEASR